MEVDGDVGRVPMTGGASIYPFCWNVLLAARSRGLGGVLTTFLSRAEPLLKKWFEDRMDVRVDRRIGRRRSRQPFDAKPPTPAKSALPLTMR